MNTIRSLPVRAYLVLSAVRERQDGQAMVEYAMILFLVSVVSIGILTVLGAKVSSLLNTVVHEF
jgi:Flp pilus assembly pilin Flp